MHITSLARTAKTIPSMQGAKSITKQIPIGQQEGTPSFSFRVFEIEAGGHTPLHTHPFEHLNYVIEGDGVVVAQDGEKPIAAGDFVLVKPGELHQYRNTSQGRFVVLCAVPKEFE